MSLEVLFKPRLCELGKIKIGKKEDKVRQAASGPWRAPMKIDHFLVTTLNRDSKGDFEQDEALMEELKKEHGDRDGMIRNLPIFVLSNEIADIQQSAWLWYKGRSLLAAKSDGVTLTKYYDPKTGRKLETPEEVEWKPEYENLKSGDAKMFKLHSTFNCVIASKSGRWGGVYKLRTTSRISGEQLYGSLIHVKQLTAGVLKGLPLSLVVRPIEVRPDNKPTIVYVVHVELRGADLHELQMKALEQKQYELQHFASIRQTEVEYRRLLRAPGDESTPAGHVDITDEFAPELAAAEIADVPAVDVKDPLFDDEPLVSDNPDDEAADAEAEVDVTVDENGEVHE